MDILIPEGQLNVDDVLLMRLAQKHPAVRWCEFDEDVKQSYARHVALLDSELRRELGAVDLSEPVAFYNAYYWGLIFARRYQARYGFDAGIEQEAFKVLERAPSEIDWRVVESVNQAAQQA